MFLRIEDHINYRTYPLDDIPATYGPMHSYFFEEKSNGPIYIPYEGESGRGRYAIIHMIDMFFNKIPFTICEYGDVMDIEKHLRVYLKSIEELYGNKGSIARDTEEMIRRTNAFYEHIFKCAKRIRNAHPSKIFKASPFVSLVREAEGVI